jgi:hypothetical protein
MPVRPSCSVTHLLDAFQVSRDQGAVLTVPPGPAHVEGYDSAVAVEVQHQVEHSLMGGRRPSGTGIASGFEKLQNLEEQMNQMSMSLTVRQTTVHGLTPEQEHEATLLRAAFGG